MKSLITLPSQTSNRIDPEALLMKAVESGQGVDTLERLLSLRERLQAEYAANQYRAALLDFQAECPKISKGQEVRDKSGEVRYRYATLEAIQDITKPILHRHGFSFDFDTVSEPSAVTVIMTVSHVAGHERKTQFRVPIDPKSFMSEPQKYEAAMSFAQRICYRNGFGIVTGTNDNNTEESFVPHPPSPLSEPPIGSGTPAHKALEARISELGLNREGVKVYVARQFAVGHFPDLTATQQRELMLVLPGMAVKKLQKLIRLMNASELDALIRIPPAWLQGMESDRERILEEADKRLIEIESRGDITRLAPTTLESDLDHDDQAAMDSLQGDS